MLLTAFERCLAAFDYFEQFFDCFWLLLPGLTAVDCFWTVFECFWLLLNVFWLLLIAFDWFLTALNCFWVVSDCFWLLLNGFWLRLIVFERFGTCLIKLISRHFNVFCAAGPWWGRQILVLTHDWMFRRALYSYQSLVCATAQTRAHYAVRASYRTFLRSSSS